MTTASELAALQQEVKDLKTIVENTQETVAGMKTTLDGLSGGKQALIFMAGFAVTIAGLIIAAIKVK